MPLRWPSRPTPPHGGRAECRQTQNPQNRPNLDHATDLAVYAGWAPGEDTGPRGLSPDDPRGVPRQWVTSLSGFASVLDVRSLGADDSLKAGGVRLGLMRLVPMLASCLMLAACGSSAPSGGSGSSGGGSSSGGGPALGKSESGVATYYAATGDGACLFGPSPNDLNVAAMNVGEWAGSAVCGECVTVTGPKGAVTVRIVDQCPDCEVGHLDLSQQAFAQIADVSAGRVPITWQVVACNVSGNISYHLKDGSSQYWTAIQVRNSRLPVANLEYMQGGAWADIPRLDYDYFVAGGGVGPGGYQVRVTAIDGQTLEDMLPAVVASATVPGSGQFH